MDINSDESGVDPEIIYAFLQKDELFNHLSPEDLKILISHFQTMIIPGGTILMEEGQIGEDLYLVLHGRLSVYKRENNQDKVITEFGAGEIVGEIGILINTPRTASVKTIRDSVLLKLNKEIFEEFTDKHPLVSLEIAKECILRLTNKSDKKNHGQIKTIAFVPLSNAEVIQQFIKNFSAELKNSLFLNSEEIDKKFRHVKNNRQLIAWLNEQEFHHEYIFYLADPEDTPWTQLCLRQADATYFLCEANQKGEIRNLGRAFFKNQAPTSNTFLFILHESRNLSYCRTSEWVRYSKVEQFFHLVPSDPKDIRKAFRLVTGNSIGVVLSGGGARGAAHIGFLRALSGLDIPIDIIGGTSIGGIIAALYSLGYDYKSLAEKYHEIIVPGSKLGYTFPYVSISAGRNIVKALKKYSGENQMIEDLWVRMFCISSNITSNEENIHKTGLLWRSLRASASLPGVYPPIFDEKGLLVDGGYLNNLPVDIMKNQFHAGKIIASLVTVSSETTEYTATGETFSGWNVLLDKLNPFEQASVKVPRIDTIIMRSMNVNDYDRQLREATHADFCVYLDMNAYGLMDYLEYEKIIEEGYKQAIKQLTS